MSCHCIDLSLFIQGLYEDIGSPQEYSLSYVSGWVYSSRNLGELNNYIDGCYSGIYYTGDAGQITGMAISPCLGENESAIYKSMFDYAFYNKAAKLAISGAGAAGAWQSLREGDSSITRVNKVELSKALRGMAKDAMDTLKDQIKFYRSNHARPSQVAGDDTNPAMPYLYQEQNPRLWPLQ